MLLEKKIISAFEAQNYDLRKAVLAKSSSLAKRYAIQLLGSYDYVKRTDVLLQEEEENKICSGGYILEEWGE